MSRHAHNPRHYLPRHGASGRTRRDTVTTVALVWCVVGTLATMALHAVHSL